MCICYMIAEMHLFFRTLLGSRAPLSSNLEDVLYKSF